MQVYTIILCPTTQVNSLFLLMYADGQNLAIRLSHHITTVTKQMKGQIRDYNDGLPESTQISWEEANDISSQTCSNILFTASNIPYSVRFQAVRLHHQGARAKEIILLKSEMKNCQALPIQAGLPYLCPLLP